MKTNILLATLIIPLITTANAEEKANCRPASTQIVGYLDQRVMREASGISFSTDHSTLFHIRDGRVRELYATALNGSQLRRIPISNYTGFDVEELISGSVAGKNYLIMADIGDNTNSRKYLRLAVMNESQALQSLSKINPAIVSAASTVFPFYADSTPISATTIYFTYPDRPQNSEAMALHPNGDLYLVTKPDSMATAGIARVYRLSKKQWMTEPATMEKPHRMEFIGEINVPQINSDAPDKYGKVVTGMDIRADGKNFVLLTYNNAIEFNLSLSDYSSKKTISSANLRYFKYQFKRLTQQEAIRYLPDGGGFMVTTEFDPALGVRAGAQEPYKSPMIKLFCR